MLATFLVSALAALHLYILILEMFLWNTPRGQRAFGLTPAFASRAVLWQPTWACIMDFLSAGLLWGVLHPEPAVSLQIQIFFTSCVTVAGLFGGLTSATKILYVQFVPGSLALASVLLGL